MRKLLILLFFTFSFVFANQNAQYLNLIAENLTRENNITTAIQKVFLFSPEYYVTCDKAVYDENKQTVEFFGNVNMVKNDQSLSLSDYSSIDLKTNKLYSYPAFVMDLKDSLWMSSSSIKSDDNSTIFEDSTRLSSCDLSDPFWSIKFSSGFQDKNDSWIHAFNTRIFLGEVPIFYTPYFGFSTDKTRRTGLLRPTIGFSNDFGFLYAQPIYFAPDQNWDLEIIPQTRGSRGNGIYGYFRYADSADSMLKIKSGYFGESDSYAIEKNLPKSHYGWDLEYSKNHIFDSADSQDAMFSSLHWLNDIDYKNLEDVNKQQNYEKKIESKINYFYKNEGFYSGAYFRYYLDSSKNSNDETLQLLPQIHLHKFSDSLLIDKLIYSLDFKYDHYIRDTGINADIYTVIAPVGYTFSFFDDYLKVSLKEIIQASKINYLNTTSDIKNGTLTQTSHNIGIGTDVLKKYNSFLHTINLDATVNIPDSQSIKGDIYLANSSPLDAIKEFPMNENGQKEVSFGVSQSFFDSNSTSVLANHKMKQTAKIGDQNELDFDKLENEITIYNSLGSISNRFVYSNIDKEITEYSSALNISKFGAFAKLNHYGTNKTATSNKQDTQYISIDTGLKFDRFYSIGYKNTYDLQNSILAKSEVIFGYNKKCWGITLRLEDSLIASSAVNVVGDRQKIVYVELALKPLGGFAQNYKLNSK